jgi:hypothetical protein
MIRASSVSPPTASARKRNAPEPLTEPPTTPSPGPFATGIGSPVTIDSSIWVSPSVTVPSTGRRSPGRTARMSPTRSSASLVSTSTPSRTTRAVSGRKAARRAMASPALALARASRLRPNRISVTITAALSK